MAAAGWSRWPTTTCTACNISRDGDYAVVDTQGGAIVVISMTGQAAPRELARTRVAPHPRHPHPHFTPNGSQIIFTDTNASNQTRVAMVAVA
jgi:hypothetical protein